MREHLGHELAAESGKVMRTSVRSSSSRPSCTDSVSDAISGSPSPRPGLPGRGPIPGPSSRTTTSSLSACRVASYLERPLVLVRVSMDDDVRARLGDREPDVGEDLLVEGERLAERPEGVAYDCDIRGSRG